MNWTIEIIPWIVIVAGLLFVAVHILKKKPCSHDRAEILNGFGIGLMSAGAMEIAIRIGDILGLVFVIGGMLMALAYGVDHIRARRIERRKVAAAMEILKREGKDIPEALK
jgi:hypothetical protein